MFQFYLPLEMAPRKQSCLQTTEMSLLQPEGMKQSQRQHLSGFGRSYSILNTTSSPSLQAFSDGALERRPQEDQGPGDTGPLTIICQNVQVGTHTHTQITHAFHGKPPATGFFSPTTYPLVSFHCLPWKFQLKALHKLLNGAKNHEHRRNHCP